MADPFNQPRCLMICRDLRDTPVVEVPQGWRIRRYTFGDESCWLRIQRAADLLNRFTAETFAEQFGRAAARLPQRQFFIEEPGGEPVGTVTAWFDDHFYGERWGRVHWLAVLPQYQGRGLGKALLSHACLQLRELGHDRAYLSTSPLRVAAVQLYRQFGFKDLAP